MQVQLEKPGIVAVQYRCNICPNGCKLSSYQSEKGRDLKIHQHACHHFPSVTTNWERINIRS